MTVLNHYIKSSVDKVRMIALIAFILTFSLNLCSGYGLNVNVSKLAVGESRDYEVSSFQEYIVQIANLTNVSIKSEINFFA